MKSAKLAYRVDADEYATIEIAYTPQHAARLASGELGEDPSDLIVTRAPEFDQYIPQGHVTPLQVIQQPGWWWQCVNCERRTSFELADDLDESEPPMQPQEHDGFIYCSDACRAAHLRTRGEQLAREQAARDATLARFPGVTVDWVNAWDANRPAHVTFILPGHTKSSGGLGWTVGTDELLGSPAAHGHYRTYRTRLEAQS